MDPTHNGQKKVYASRGMHTSDTWLSVFQDIYAS